MGVRHIAKSSLLDVFFVIEDYIELLYEDVPGKVKGASFILQLSRSDTKKNTRYRKKYGFLSGNF